MKPDAPKPCPRKVFEDLLDEYIRSGDGPEDPVGDASERAFWAERWNVAVKQYELELTDMLNGLPPPAGYREDH